MLSWAKKLILFNRDIVDLGGKFTTYIFEDFHESCKLSKTLFAARWRRPARNETNIFFLTNFMEEFQRITRPNVGENEREIFSGDF